LVDDRGAYERWNIGKLSAFGARERGAIGELVLQFAQLLHGAMEGAFIGEIEAGDGLHALVERAGGE
jgi:hypothetical protein